MKNAFQFKTRDPDQFETIMAPMVGQVHARPVQTTAFDATVTVRTLQKTALFTVLADSIHVNVAPALSNTCLDIALGKPFPLPTVAKSNTS